MRSPTDRSRPVSRQRLTTYVSPPPPPRQFRERRRSISRRRPQNQQNRKRQSDNQSQTRRTRQQQSGNPPQDRQQEADRSSDNSNPSANSVSNRVVVDNRAPNRKIRRIVETRVHHGMCVNCGSRDHDDEQCPETEFVYPPHFIQHDDIHAVHRPAAQGRTEGGGESRSIRQTTEQNRTTPYQQNQQNRNNCTRSSTQTSGAYDRLQQQQQTTTVNTDSEQTETNRVQTGVRQPLPYADISRSALEIIIIRDSTISLSYDESKLITEMLDEDLNNLPIDHPNPPVYESFRWTTKRFSIMVNNSETKKYVTDLLRSKGYNVLDPQEWQNLANPTFIRTGNYGGRIVTPTDASFRIALRRQCRAWNLLQTDIVPARPIRQLKRVDGSLKRSWTFAIKLTKEGLDSLNQHGQDVNLGIVGNVKFISIQEERTKLVANTQQNNTEENDQMTSTPMDTETPPSPLQVRDISNIQTDMDEQSTIPENSQTERQQQQNTDNGTVDTLNANQSDDLGNDGEAIINSFDTETFDMDGTEVQDLLRDDDVDLEHFTTSVSDKLNLNKNK